MLMVGWWREVEPGEDWALQRAWAQTHRLVNTWAERVRCARSPVRPTKMGGAWGTRSTHLSTRATNCLSAWRRRSDIMDPCRETGSGAVHELLALLVPALRLVASQVRAGRLSTTAAPLLPASAGPAIDVANAPVRPDEPAYCAPLLPASPGVGVTNDVCMALRARILGH